MNLLKRKHDAIINALKSIPNLREGRINFPVLASYYHDIVIYKRFVLAVESANRRKQIESLSKEWDSFIQMRDLEDYPMHHESSNYAFYDMLFR